MKINSSLSALGNLLALIVDSNPAFAVATEQTLGVLSQSAVTADAEGRNTVVVVTVDGYTDSQSFTFTRLGLTDSITAPAPAAISLTGTEKAADVLAAVAKALNLVPSELTLNASWINADGSITVPTPAADGSVTTGLSVSSNAGSNLYVDGSVLSLTINFPSVPVAPAPSITTLVVNAALNGFESVNTPAAPAADGTSSTTQPVAPAADGTSGTTTTTGTDGQAAGGTTAPAADGTTGTTPAAPAADGQSSTTEPAAPAADGQAAAGTDGQPTSSN